MTASPCTNVCQLDPLGKFCVGCLRTIGEIQDWGAMTDEQRGSVVRAIEQRRVVSLQVTPQL